LDLSLKLLDLVSVLDFPIVVEQAVGGWAAKRLWGLGSSKGASEGVG